MGQHGTTIKKMENFLHPTLKYPAAPKIPSSVDTPKYPAWRNPLALGHGTAWDHYKMENFLHPTLKYPAAPKNTQLCQYPKIPSLEKSFGFGTWDSMGPL